jgi:hypothetical protein
MKKLLILILLFLMGCNNVHEGYIVEKRFEPARTYTIVTPIIINKTVHQIPQQYYDDADYILVVRDPSTDDEGIFYVDQLYWNSARLDDPFADANVECSTVDND